MKKGVKIFLGILVIIVVLVVIFVLIKYFKNNNQNPTTGDDEIITNIPKYATKNLEDLPKDYSKEQAIVDNCLVIGNDKIYNKSQLDNFLNNVSPSYTKNPISDKLRIVQFTIEGQMIIKDIEYTADGKYIIANDLTRDEYSAEEDRKITKEEYSANEYKLFKSMGNEYVEILLLTNEGKTEDSILICTYSRNIELQELPSFYGKIIETKENSMLVETLEGEDKRQNLSDKYTFETDKNYEYEVGTIVKVTYTGLVRESYPAQIDMVNLEKVDLEKFNLIFENSNEERVTILSTEDGITEYNVYSFEGDMFVIIDEKIMNLRQALLENKITMEEILNKAREDAENEQIVKSVYSDGGSTIYKYKNYSIIKCNRLDNNKDVYLGNTDLLL